MGISYQTSRSRLWGEVARQLGYDGLLGVSTQLKNAYQRIILPFEQFSDHIRNSPAMSALSPASFRFYGPPGRMGAQSSASASRMSRHRAYPPTDKSANASGDRSRLSTPISMESSSLSEGSEGVERKAVQDDIKIEISAPSTETKPSSVAGIFNFQGLDHDSDIPSRFLQEWQGASVNTPTTGSVRRSGEAGALRSGRCMSEKFLRFFPHTNIRAFRLVRYATAEIVGLKCFYVMGAIEV